MANTSILAAFERMWQHLMSKLDTKLDKTGGTMTGILTLSGNPTEDFHAATKQYVDNAKEVFIAEYNVTPYEDMLAAYNAGKMLFLSYTDTGGSHWMLPFMSEAYVQLELFMFSTNSASTTIIAGYHTGLNAWTSTITDLVTMVSNTFTTQVAAQNNTNYTTKQVRNIILVADGEDIPAGANGDICLVYAP